MDPTRVAGAIMSFEDTLAGDKLLWGLGGSFGKNMKTISKHFGERVAVCAKHPTTRCEEWWEGTLQLSKNDRVIVLKYAARWNDEIDDLNDVDAHDDGLSDHTLEKRFDADDVVNVRRLTAEEDGDLLDGADDAVSKLRTPPADAPGRPRVASAAWRRRRRRRREDRRPPPRSTVERSRRRPRRISSPGCDRRARRRARRRRLNRQSRRSIARRT